MVALRLPIQEGEDFKEYLTSPPELPAELPQDFSQFLLRIVAHPSDKMILSVTQRLMSPGVAGPLVLLDSDVSDNSEFSPNVGEISASLEALRSRLALSRSSMTVLSAWQDLR